MRCREVMTENPACCLKTDTVVDAARMMRANDVGPIPVVDSQSSKTLIGIVTDRDLAMKIVAENRIPKEVLVDAVMTKDIVTCGPDDDLEDAMTSMELHHLRRIPVVDRDNRILGIIAQADVARTESVEKTGEVVAEISQP